MTQLTHPTIANSTKTSSWTVLPWAVGVCTLSLSSCPCHLVPVTLSLSPCPCHLSPCSPRTTVFALCSPEKDSEVTRQCSSQGFTSSKSNKRRRQSKNVSILCTWLLIWLTCSKQCHCIHSRTTWCESFACTLPKVVPLISSPVPLRLPF